jgi:hypothetical protein
LAASNDRRGERETAVSAKEFVQSGDSLVTWIDIEHDQTVPGPDSDVRERPAHPPSTDLLLAECRVL